MNLLVYTLIKKKKSGSLKYGSLSYLEINDLKDTYILENRRLIEILKNKKLEDLTINCKIEDITVKMRKELLNLNRQAILNISVASMTNTELTLLKSIPNYVLHFE